MFLTWEIALSSSTRSPSLTYPPLALLQASSRMALTALGSTLRGTSPLRRQESSWMSFASLLMVQKVILPATSGLPNLLENLTRISSAAALV